MSLSQEEEQNKDKRFSDKTWPSWSVDQREPTFITLEGNNLEDVFGKINKQLKTLLRICDQQGHEISSLRLREEKSEEVITHMNIKMAALQDRKSTDNPLFLASLEDGIAEAKVRIKNLEMDIEKNKELTNAEITQLRSVIADQKYVVESLTIKVEDQQKKINEQNNAIETLKQQFENSFKDISEKIECLDQWKTSVSVEILTIRDDISKCNHLVETVKEKIDNVSEQAIANAANAMEFSAGFGDGMMHLLGKADLMYSAESDDDERNRIDDQSCEEEAVSHSPSTHGALLDEICDPSSNAASPVIDFGPKLGDEEPDTNGEVPLERLPSDGSCTIRSLQSFDVSPPSANPIDVSTLPSDVDDVISPQSMSGIDSVQQTLAKVNSEVGSPLQSISKPFPSDNLVDEQPSPSPEIVADKRVPEEKEKAVPEEETAVPEEKEKTVPEEDKKEAFRHKSSTKLDKMTSEELSLCSGVRVLDRSISRSGSQQGKPRTLPKILRGMSADYSKGFGAAVMKIVSRGMSVTIPGAASNDNSDDEKEAENQDASIIIPTHSPPSPKGITKDISKELSSQEMQRLQNLIVELHQRVEVLVSQVNQNHEHVQDSIKAMKQKWNKKYVSMSEAVKRHGEQQRAITANLDGEVDGCTLKIYQCARCFQESTGTESCHSITQKLKTRSVLELPMIENKKGNPSYRLETSASITEGVWWNLSR